MAFLKETGRKFFDRFMRQAISHGYWGGRASTKELRSILPTLASLIWRPFRTEF
jgi:hypothetical protein